MNKNTSYVKICARINNFTVLFVLRFTVIVTPDL